MQESPQQTAPAVLVRPKRAVEVVPVSARTLRRWRAAGRLRVHRPAGNVAMYEMEDLLALVRGEKAGPVALIEGRSAAPPA